MAIKTNTQQKMTAPATVVVHTVLFDKTIEEKRNFLLNNYEMDNLLGDKNAKISIIEYSSFTCKYCKKLRKEINKIIQEYVYNKKIANYATRPLYNTKTIPFGAFIQCSRQEDKQKIIDNFEEEKEKMVRVRCIYEPYYDDVELKRRVVKGEEFEVEESRAEYLAKNNAVIILEEPKKEEVKIEEKPKEEVKPKKNIFKKAKK